MVLISCRECNESVSTEAVACPDCGAQQPSPVPPAQLSEEQIYADNAVSVSCSRVVICGTTYPLRNITAVEMASTPPRVFWPIILLTVGALILLATFFPFNDAKAPVGVYLIAGVTISVGIFRLLRARTHFHICLTTASGRFHVLTSTNESYIRRVIVDINEAIVKSV